jgi:hypothetical protein
MVWIDVLAHQERIRSGKESHVLLRIRTDQTYSQNSFTVPLESGHALCLRESFIEIGSCSLSPTLQPDTPLRLNIFPET